MDSTTFIQRVRTAIVAPNYQARFTTDDLLGIANDEQMTMIVTELKNIREEYFTVRTEIPTTVGNSKVYIPERAPGRTARDIRYLDQGGLEYNLPRIQLEDTYIYTNQGAGTPSGFYLMSDDIVLIPTPSAAGTCVLYWDFMPSKIVQMTRVAKIIAVGVDSVTVASVPTNLTIGLTTDITRQTPAYKVTHYDRAITNIAGNVITLAGFSVSVPITNVSVGDYISLARETGLVQLPDEAQDALVIATALRVVEALNLADQVKIVQDRYNRKIRLMRDLMQPRVEGASKKIIQRNGLIRSRGTMRRFPSVSVP